METFLRNIPTRKELLSQIILLLKSSKSGLTTTEIDSKVAEALKLEESVTKILHSGTRTKYSYEMAWPMELPNHLPSFLAFHALEQQLLWEGRWDIKERLLCAIHSC